MAFNLISKSQIREFKAISSSINSSFSRCFGEFGLAKAGIIILNEAWKPEKQAGIIRVNNNYVDQLKASLAMIKEIEGKEVIVKSLGVSGMLNKAENYLEQRR